MRKSQGICLTYNDNRLVTQSMSNSVINPYVKEQVNDINKSERKKDRRCYNLIAIYRGHCTLFDDHQSGSCIEINYTLFDFHGQIFVI